MFSPSDLALYMQSPFAFWMERRAKEGPALLDLADQDSDLLEALQDKGAQHEQALLAQFTKEGRQLVDITQAADGPQATLVAMQGGAEVIYQAALQSEYFKGYADFLVRVPGASRFGDYHYEVWDTKLSKTVKPQYSVQLCCYQDMLQQLQGCYSEEFVVVLGSQQQCRFYTSDYFYYYRALRDEFLNAFTQNKNNNLPDPAESKDWGRWQTYAQHRLRESDSLLNVATVSRAQMKKLQAAGITTLNQLAGTRATSVAGINAALFSRLKSQAEIQQASEGQDKPKYRVLAPESGKKIGLAMLPPHSDLDVFFDIEGYPLAEGGLEYLWGNAFFDADGKRQFKDFWGHNPEQEKQAFQDFIQWVYGRWQQDPQMHVYHYANYEIAACRKLMSRYGVCEFETDELLRNEVFVDLYKIVKSGLVIGEPKYSIKNVEHLYRGQRQTQVGTGGDSVVVYDRWRDQPDGEDWRSSKILKSIRDYNIDDCDSTQELVAWLRERQREQGIAYLGQTQPKQTEIPEEVSRRTQLRDTLLALAQSTKEQDDATAAAMEILAWSLEFHRREAKPVFWRRFDRLGLTDLELVEDLDCLALCTRSAREPFKPSPRARNLAYEYHFNPDQEFKFTENTKSFFILGEDDDKGKTLSVTLLPEHTDLSQGLITVQSKLPPPQKLTLIPDEFVNPEPIPTAIEKVAEEFLQDSNSNRAILSFLKRDFPNIRGLKKGETITRSHNPAERLGEIIEAVLKLDHSYLVIQGPPGAGKTFTGKHIITQLLKQGKKVGISSNSHKAINNLLLGCAEYCREQAIAAQFFCTKDTDVALSDNQVQVIKNNEIAAVLTSACVVGTTAWGFARSELHRQFDYLFIDEAGQVSLANLIGVSQATENIVLMGDQMQLGQPAQGTHPGDSGLSTLDYLLQGSATIAENRGIFLETTYRMHSAVNRFISDAIYQGKLNSHPDNDRQVIALPEPPNGLIKKAAGIVYLPVAHEGNTQASDEEVELIVRAAQELLGREFTDKNKHKRPIAWADMLFVAPYNFQVNKLKQALPVEAKVGSVDKFQGQEAPVVFLSMCASDADESPRGSEFLFDKNRLNVAVSRAQALAVVVASPALVHSRASNLAQQRMINTYCALVQYALDN